MKTKPGTAYKERTLTCVGCKIVITKKMPKGRTYCSLSCYRTSERPNRKNGQIVPCSHCKADVYVRKSLLEERTDHFCCQEHYFVWWGRNKDVYTCCICEKTFKWSPSRKFQNNVKYCSLQCRDKDPQRTEMLILMNQKQQTMRQSSIETIGYAMLDDLGIEYLPQHMIAKKFCVDAFVPSLGIVIQFDGDYWHGNSAKFDVLDERQLKRSRLDFSQDRYMKKCGYQVLRVWESTIKKQPDLVQDLFRQTLIQQSQNQSLLETNQISI